MQHATKLPLAWRREGISTVAVSLADATVPTMYQELHLVILGDSPGTIDRYLLRIMH